MGVRPCGLPPDREIGFVSFVRASDAKLCERVSEGCSSTLSLRTENSPPPSPPSPSPSSPSRIDCCVLHGFYRFPFKFAVIYMGFTGLLF